MLASYPADKRVRRHFRPDSCKRGLTWQIIQTGKIVVVNETQEDERVDEQCARFIGCFGGAPIPGENGNQGVLYVYGVQPGKFISPDFEDKINLLARLTGEALEITHSIRHLRLHDEYMQSLVSLGGKLTEARTDESLAELALQFSVERLNADSFLFGIYDPDRDELKFPVIFEGGERKSGEKRVLGQERDQWGICGYIIRSGQEAYFTNTESMQQACEEWGITAISIGETCQSCYFLPLQIEQGMLGVISIQSNREGAFSAEIREAFRSLGNLFSVTLENNRLLSRTQKFIEQMEALNLVVLDIGRGENQDQLLDNLINRATQLLDARGGAIYLLDSAGEFFEQKAHREYPLQLVGRKIRVHEGLNGKIYQSGKVECIEDYSTWDKRIMGFDSTDMRAVIGAPIRFDEDCIGTLIVRDDKPGRSFKEDEQVLLQLLADYAGLIINKVRNLERTRALLHMTADIGRLADLKVMYQRTCRDAVNFFGVEHSGLVIFDEKHEWGIVEGEYPERKRERFKRIPIKGIPVEEKLINESTPIILPNVEETGEELGAVREILLRGKILSMLAVPIILHEKVIGSFSLDSVGHRRIFKSEEVKLCELFADHVAMAVENATMYEKQQKGEDLLSSLFKASASIASMKSQEQVLNTIVETIEKTIGTDRVAFVRLRQGEDPQMLVERGFKNKADISEIIREEGKSITREVVRSGKARYIEDVNGHKSEVNPITIENNVESIGWLPMTISERRIGVLEVQFQKKHKFTEAEQKALQVYANQAAIAYDRARHADEMEALNRAAMSFAQLSDEDTLLQHILTSACEVLMADHAFVLMQQQGSTGDEWENVVTDPRMPEDLRRLIIQRDETVLQLARKVYDEESLFIPRLDMVNLTKTIDEHLAENMMICNLRSLMGIALKAGKETLGVLIVCFLRQVSFYEEDRSISSTYGRQASLALKNVVLMNRLLKAQKAASLVAKVSTQEDLNTTLELIADRSMEVLDCDAVVLFPFDPEDKTFFQQPILRGVDDPEPIMNQPLVPEHSVVWKVLERDAVYIAEDAQNDRSMRGPGDPETGTPPFVIREKIISSAGVPLKTRDKKVGVLFVNHRKEHHFSDAEKEFIELYGNQAAVAIRNAQLLEKADRQTAMLKAMYEAGKAITSLLSLDEILTRIVEESIKLTTARGKAAYFCHIGLVEGNIVSVAVAEPKEDPLVTEGKLPRAVEPWGKSNSGIVGRAVRTAKTQLVADVSQDADYINADMRTKCELVVPILLNKKVIGIINLEHIEVGGLDKDDQFAIEGLAAQAAIAISNARSFEQLIQTQGVVRRQTELANIGMVNSIWRHTIDKKVINIKLNIDRLRKELKESGANLESKILKRLDTIDRLAEDIREKQMTPPLGSEEGVLLVNIDEMVGERVKQMRENDEWKGLTLRHIAGLTVEETVRISPEWLKKALDILLENAREATRERETRIIQIITSRVEKRVRLEVQDNGKGIPQKHIKSFLREKIKKGGHEKGMGIGVLMARSIVQAYGGEINLVETGNEGTRIEIFLPLEYSTEHS